ncbi:hypothetical protein [Streptomyces buecherae]|uniref:hypothetical protein n=1 Tax=Streptomyces buecherae TaxID=2763006 RepID=UPI001C25ABDD|nr:hypothetical protein [Streptomyces buecherae]
METIASRDGTVIAYDRVGAGPPVVVVAGASCDRGAQATLAGALARQVLADQDHHVDPEAIAPVVARFAGAAARA